MPPAARAGLGSSDFQVIPERCRWSVYWLRMGDIRPGAIDNNVLIHRFWRRSVAEHVCEHLQLAFHAGLNEASRG